MGSVWPPFVNWIEFVRVYKGRLGLQDNIQAVFIFATGLKFKERATQSEHQHCRGHGEHRASHEAGDRVHCGREGGKLHPDRIGGEVVARGAGGVRG